jgi:hypothetical protein
MSVGISVKLGLSHCTKHQSEGASEQGAEEDIWSYGGESEKWVAQQCNGDLHDWFCSLHVTEGTKCRRIRLAGYM